MSAIRNVAVFAAAMLVAACAHVGTEIDTDAVAKVQKGVTTKAQLIEIMGSAPQFVSLTGDGKQSLMWIYTRSKADGKMFIPFAGPFIGGVNTQQQTFQAIIDKDGIVQDTLYNTSAMKSGAN